MIILEYQCTINTYLHLD